MVEFQLSEYDATVLTEERSFADYFENVIGSYPPSPPGEGLGVRPKSAANWMLGPVKTWLNEENKEIDEFPVNPEQLALVINLVDSGKLSFSAASTKLFSRMLDNPGKDPEEMATELNLIQQSDLSAIGPAK